MRIRDKLVIVFATSTLVVGVSSPAQAAPGTPYLWRNSEAVFGVSCGVSSGGQVRAIQAILWAGHFYARTLGQSMEATKSQVDGYFGTRTNNALRLYQSEHYLPVDGCARAGTLDMMQNHLPFGTRTDMDAKLYRGVRPYKEPQYPEEIGFFYDPCCDYLAANGQWRFQWFGACYTMWTPSTYTGSSCV